MTVTEVALLTTALGSAVPAIGTFVLTALNKRDIRRLEINTNSLKDALVASTAKASHAEGMAEGKASEKANPS